MALHPHLWLRFSFSIKIAQFLGLIFVLLSAFEIANALTEAGHNVAAAVKPFLPAAVFGFAHWLFKAITIEDTRVLICISILSLLVSVLLGLHHHMLTERVREYQRFLGALRTLTQESIRLSVSKSRDKALRFIEQGALQTLTDWRGTNPRERKRFAATLLETRDDAQTFRLLCQSPEGIYNIPNTGITGPCAAQRSIHAGPLIYVPHTGFSHGVRLEWSMAHRTFTNADLAEDAFVNIPHIHKNLQPRSTICFLIPAGLPNSQYVLCLDCDRYNPFKLVDYEAVHLIGNVIAQIMIDLHEHGGGPAVAAKAIGHSA